MLSKFLFHRYFFREFSAGNFILQLSFAIHFVSAKRISTVVKVSCPFSLSLVMDSTSLTTA